MVSVMMAPALVRAQQTSENYRVEQGSISAQASGNSQSASYQTYPTIGESAAGAMSANTYTAAVGFTASSSPSINNSSSEPQTTQPGSNGSPSFLGMNFGFLNAIVPMLPIADTQQPESTTAEFATKPNYIPTLPTVPRSESSKTAQNTASVAASEPTQQPTRPSAATKANPPIASSTKSTKVSAAHAVREYVATSMRSVQATVAVVKQKVSNAVLQIVRWLSGLWWK